MNAPDRVVAAESMPASTTGDADDAPGTAPFVLAAVVVVAVTCFVYAGRMPIAHWWYDYGDVLIFEGVARDLWHGGSLLDWRLPQAASLFPDIALEALLVPLLPLGQATLWIHAIYGVLGAVGWWLLARMLGAARGTAVLAPLAYSAVFMSSPLAPALHSSIAMYFGLVGHHSSVGAMMPLALAALLALWRTLQGYAHRRISPVVAGIVLLFLLALSDSLFIVGLLLPIAAVCVLAAALPHRLPSRESRVRAAVYAALLAMIVIMAVLAGRMLVFDSRQSFGVWLWARFVQGFPGLTLDAARTFARFVAESWFTSVLMFAWFAVLAMAAARLGRLLVRGEWRAGRPLAADDGESLILLTAACGGAVAAAIDVAVGLFVSVDHSRQIAGFVISSLALVPVLVALEGRRWPRVMVPVLAACLVGLYWYRIANLPAAAYELRYAQVVRCLDREFPKGVDFASEFWTKVAIDFWSEGRFRGVISTPKYIAAYTNGQNVIRTRQVRPTVAIVDRHFPDADYYREFLDAYGPPARTIECPTGMVVLDYSNNPAFIERHTAAAKAAQ